MRTKNSALHEALRFIGWSFWALAKIGIMLAWPWLAVLSLEGIARALPRTRSTAVLKAFHDGSPFRLKPSHLLDPLKSPAFRCYP